jgi:mono/diheme cytochrome c family protein
MMKPLQLSRVIWGTAFLLVALPFSVFAQEADGRALYDKNCKSCHGPAGGKPPNAMVIMMKTPSVTEPVLLKGFSADSLRAILLKGTHSPFMRPNPKKMTDDEIRALVIFPASFRSS